MPTTTEAPTLLNVVGDPEAARARLAELEAKVKAATETQRAAEQAVTHLAGLLKIANGEFGQGLRDLISELKSREDAVAKNEARFADMQNRLGEMREITQ